MARGDFTMSRGNFTSRRIGGWDKAPENGEKSRKNDTEYKAAGYAPKAAQKVIDDLMEVERFQHSHQSPEYVPLNDALLVVVIYHTLIIRQKRGLHSHACGTIGQKIIW